MPEQQPERPHLSRPQPLPRGQVALSSLMGLLEDAVENERRWTVRRAELEARVAAMLKRQGGG